MLPKIYKVTLFMEDEKSPFMKSSTRESMALKTDRHASVPDRIFAETACGAGGNP
jgi:hypothetical protein